MAEWAEIARDSEVVRDAVGDLNRLLADSTPNDTNLAWLAALILDLTDSATLIRDALSLAEGWAAVMMEGDETRLPDGTRLTRMWSKARHDWDNDRLRRDVVNSVRASAEPDVVDPDTGERTLSWEPMARALAGAYYLSGSNVRIRWLQDHGLAAGDYCEEGAWVHE